MTTTATLILRIGVFRNFFRPRAGGAAGEPGLDLVVAMLVLFKPIRLVLLCAALWAFATALVRPFAGLPVLVFVGRDANWAAPLALLCVRGLATQLAGLGAIIHANLFF